MDKATRDVEYVSRLESGLEQARAQGVWINLYVLIFKGEVD